MGGSDQWGNVTAGLELIRKKIQGDAYAFSWPLLLNNRGVKFGKSESGALWLDAAMTSPFKFHQFFLNSSDQDVIKLLKIFTFMNQAEIAALEDSLRTCPEKREAQKALADAICAVVHGDQALEDAKRGAQVLFGGSLKGVPISWLEEIFSEVPSAALPLERLKEMSVVDLLAASQAVPSKAEAKRLAQSGGIYLNNERVTDGTARISDLGVLDQKLFVVRTGKKSYHLIRVE